MFLAEVGDRGMMLLVKAMAIYKASTLELLKQLLVLMYIALGQLLYKPKLLSVT